jgi:hypothetical protein
MNSKYSLDADTNRWWWGPAAAGALCAVSITAVVAVSAGSTVATADRGPGSGSDRPCFIVQPRWNSALAGPQPTCPLEDDAPASPGPAGVLRPWLHEGAL